MNGAIAEPFARMSKPPKTNITMMIGSNQNFLRTRMKRQSSMTRLTETSYIIKVSPGQGSFSQPWARRAMMKQTAEAREQERPAQGRLRVLHQYGQVI